MVLRKDDKCSFCLTERENIKHLSGDIQLSTTDILFGKVGNNNGLINHLILLTKQYIYNSRIAGNGVALNYIVNILRIFLKLKSCLQRPI